MLSYHYHRLQVVGKPFQMASLGLGEWHIKK
jgi:hypothetical protein